MLQLQHNQPLQHLNTFGMKVTAANYSVLRDTQDLADVQEQAEFQSDLLVLGSGSNILFTADPPQWIIHNKIMGVELLKEDAAQVWLKVGAGEVWHNFVRYCIDKGYAGIENLSLIPGTVGAAPVQNIGAYGVEVKEVIESVHFWQVASAQFSELANQDCIFGYRNSIFKNPSFGKTIITHVVFRLNKQPEFRIDYGQIRQELEQMHVQELSIKSISDAVIRIRSSKLPDPKVLGNAGSFFKNPEAPLSLYQKLQEQNPSIPGYPLPDSNSIKIPAAWLIEQCGWKGFREGDYGVHKNQALVLVNYGDAQGLDIAQLSLRIMDSVAQKFHIELEREVRIC